MPTYAQLLKDFRELDFDGDGIIDAEEFLAILQRDGENGDLDVGTAGMMLKSIARHADGKVGEALRQSAWIQLPL
jgi:Ca2+-binding EF-hand superfamily protein